MILSKEIPGSMVVAQEKESNELHLASSVQIGERVRPAPKKTGR